MFVIYTFSLMGQHVKHKGNYINYQWVIFIQKCFNILSDKWILTQRWVFVIPRSGLKKFDIRVETLKTNDLYKFCLNFSRQKNRVKIVVKLYRGSFYLRGTIESRTTRRRKNIRGKIFQQKQLGIINIKRRCNNVNCSQ